LVAVFAEVVLVFAGHAVLLGDEAVLRAQDVEEVPRVAVGIAHVADENYIVVAVYKSFINVTGINANAKAIGGNGVLVHRAVVLFRVVNPSGLRHLGQGFGAYDLLTVIAALIYEHFE